MADDRYRESSRSGGARGRGSSIFSDDEGDRWDGGRWQGDRHDGRRGAGGDEDGGFFRRAGEEIKRAGEEVRSWFANDEEGGRRGGSSSYRDNRPGGFGGDRSFHGERHGGSGGFGGERYRPSYQGGDDGDERPTGYRSNQATGREQSGTSHFDENYRRWRDRQIAELDREYEDYCRERQQRFESDFDGWRRSRPASGTSQGSAAGQNGGIASGTTDTLGAPGAGATTESSDASAMEPGTGRGRS